MGKSYQKTLYGIIIGGILFFSQLFSLSSFSYGQANIIEEEDHYKIYVGNYYDITVPKFTAPKAYLTLGRLGEIFLKFNYISEYLSPGVFMNSLNNLYGKGYDFNHLNWEMVGFSDIDKTCINYTKINLDRNASINLSMMIFNQNTTINNYEVCALSEIFVQINITNWFFSDLARGLALNIITGLEQSTNYFRRGPYTNFETSTNYVQILTNKYNFHIEFKTQILIITDSQQIETYETVVFANYNIGVNESEPADFWISVPKRLDISQMILSFKCYYDFEGETGTNDISFFIILVALSGFALITNVIYRKKERRER